MNNDAITFQQPTGAQPPDRRELLWNELARLHTQLGIEPPTATYTLEALEEEVILARRAVQQPAVEGHADFDSLPFDAPPDGGDHRPRKTWRNFCARLFLPEHPRPEPCVMHTPPPCPPAPATPESRSTPTDEHTHEADTTDEEDAAHGTATECDHVRTYSKRKNVCTILVA